MTEQQRKENKRAYKGTLGGVVAGTSIAYGRKIKDRVLSEAKLLKKPRKNSLLGSALRGGVAGNLISTIGNKNSDGQADTPTDVAKGLVAGGLAHRELKAPQKALSKGVQIINKKSAPARKAAGVALRRSAGYKKSGFKSATKRVAAAMIDSKPRTNFKPKNPTRLKSMLGGALAAAAYSKYKSKERNNWE
jgi:hypothetical protein